MRIRDAVQPDRIFLDLDGGQDGRAIAVVSRRLSAATGLDATLVDRALTEREELGSTAVGNGFAIPHCKLLNLDEIVVALARFDAGVDFGRAGTPDEVTFFFVVLSPPDQPTEHLQILSQIARVLKNPEFREELMGGADEASIVSAIQRASEQEGL